MPAGANQIPIEMIMRTLLGRSTSLVCLALAGMVSLEFAGVLPAAEIPRSDPPQTATAATNRLDGASQQWRGRFGGQERGVYKSQITPHWFQNNTRFWYRNDLRAGAKEFIVVDAETGRRQPAFDHQRLAAALTKNAGEEFKADHLPFSEIEFVEEGKAIRCEVAAKIWRCDLASYECSVVPDSGSSASSPTTKETDDEANRR